MPARRFGLAVALVGADYLGWRWALGTDHATMALVAGLALVALAIAALWLFVLAVLTSLARGARAMHAHHALVLLRPRRRARAHKPPASGAGASPSERIAA